MIADLANPYGIEAKSGYIDTLNDSETGRDDYLTAGFRGRIVTVHAFLAADYSMMTYKAARRRTDQVALAAGGVYTHDELSLKVGGGAVLDGRAGGSGLQNWWHGHTSKRLQACCYEHRHAEPLLMAEASYRWAWLDVAASLRSFDLVPCLRYGDEASAFSLGWAWHADELSPTARRVAQTMTGPFVRVGLTVGMPDAGPAVAIELSGQSVLGSLGFAW